MKCVVDKDGCISCGLCEGINPEIFSEDEDGKYISVDRDLADDEIASALEAVESCPVSVISMVG